MVCVCVCVFRFLAIDTKREPVLIMVFSLKSLIFAIANSIEPHVCNPHSVTKTMFGFITFKRNVRRADSLHWLCDDNALSAGFSDKSTSHKRTGLSNVTTNALHCYISPTFAEVRINRLVHPAGLCYFRFRVKYRQSITNSRIHPLNCVHILNINKIAKSFGRIIMHDFHNNISFIRSRIQCGRVIAHIFLNTCGALLVVVVLRCCW